MKKLLALALMLVLVISLASCEMLPEGVAGALEGVKDSITGIFSGDHTHVYEVVETKGDGCVEDQYVKSVCACGDVLEETIPASGHDPVRVGGKDPTCVDIGTEKTKCSKCGKIENNKIPATGHNLVSDEPSRGSYCTNSKCPYFVLNLPSDGKYAENFKFTFGDEEKAALEAIHEELAAILNNAEDYDPEKHAYAETGELADAYAAAEAIAEEYNDLIWAARDQYSVAMTLYYVNIENKELEETYNGIMEYYNTLVAKFYELSQPWYDSMFREFYYYGMTEAEINAFLADSGALSNPEYIALKDRNDKIELELYNIADPMNPESDEVAILYAEFAANNNEIAKLLGFENYLEYAYENVYGREYSYEDVDAFLEYVKRYLVPIYNNLYEEILSINLSSDPAGIEAYYAATQDSFFDKRKPNTVLNNFIDYMGLSFTKDGEEVTFSDTLNNLVLDGNLFRGSYEGAFVSSLADAEIPFAYFGTGYNSIFTVVHEFGHYMNEIYNESQYDQSYDLLEIHSQGHEALLLYYIEKETVFSGTGLDAIRVEQLLNYFATIMSGLQINAFETAIYLDEYDGYGSEEIMADGTITYDEYDELYAYIATDFGISPNYQNNTYWRNGMTISSPCYYVSYSVSAVNSLQLYIKAHTEGLDAAKESYLKLINYTDVDPDYDMNQVLDYAGLDSYLEETMYRKMAEYFLTNQ